VAGWLAAQSARQCGPCRFGLPALAQDVAALAAGVAPALPAALGHAGLLAGRGACSHPDAAANFVGSGLRVLTDEIQRHAAEGSCGRPVRGRLLLGDPQ
jgi:NADH:ubiquinone oxidoreductase subunit F (NADH-binding)